MEHSNQTNFFNTEVQEYLVQTRIDGTDECQSLKSKSEIISMIDMSDCYPIEIKVFDVSKFGEVQELEIHGTWHNPKNPLYIKLTNENGEIVFDGYGVDH